MPPTSGSSCKRSVSPAEPPGSEGRAIRGPQPSRPSLFSPATTERSGSPVYLKDRPTSLANSLVRPIFGRTIRLSAKDPDRRSQRASTPDERNRVTDTDFGMDSDDEGGLGVAVGRAQRVVSSSNEEGCFFTLEREEILPRNGEVSVVQAGFAASSGSRWWGKPAARLAPPSEEGAIGCRSFRRFQPPPHRGRIGRGLTVHESPHLIPSLQRWFTVSLHSRGEAARHRPSLIGARDGECHA